MLYFLSNFIMVIIGNAQSSGMITNNTSKSVIIRRIFYAKKQISGCCIYYYYGHNHGYVLGLFLAATGVAFSATASSSVTPVRLVYGLWNVGGYCLPDCTTKLSIAWIQALPNF